MSVTRARAVGCGHYLPSRVVTNEELAARLDTTDEWIRTRTGIRRRHVAADNENTSDLAIAAALSALDNAGLAGADIDAIVLATATPDQTFPATATRVQHAIGMTGGFAFDLHAVCAGFIYGIASANSLILTGLARRVLVIGSETFSRILDWNDRSTCVLFGDGAGAVVLEAGEQPGERTDRGVLTTRLRSDGRYRSKLYVDGGPSTTGTVGHLRMEGREVFRHAVGMITDVVEDAFKATGYGAKDIDWFVPHQANKRIIDGSAHKLGIAPEKIVSTVDRHGNTSAASIPLALADAHVDRRIKPGHLVLLEAMGGGFTWASAIIRW